MIDIKLFFLINCFFLKSLLLIKKSKSLFKVRNIIIKSCLVAAVTFPFCAAIADAKELNRKEGDWGVKNLLIADFYADNNNQITNQKNNYKTGYSRFDLYSHLKPIDNFTINSHLKFENIFDDYQVASRDISATSSSDQTSRNNYFKIKELNLKYDFDKYSFTAGKFSANFGTAWRFNEGIWLRDMAHNYLQDEKLGAIVSAKLGDQKNIGEYNFGFAMFANNGSNLDNSPTISRDSNYQYNSNLSNKKSPSSYLASLDILYDFGDNEKLSYHFSHINLAPNQRFSKINGAKISNQRAWSLGSNYKYPLLKELQLDAMVEYTKINGVGGNANVRDNYLIANLVNNICQNYNITFGYGRHRNVIVSNRNGFNQDFFEVSGGYKFNRTKFFDHLSVQIGYKEIRTNFKTKLEKWQDYGARLVYSKNF